jgi:hypothetical protein
VPLSNNTIHGPYIYSRIRSRHTDPPANVLGTSLQVVIALMLCISGPLLQIVSAFDIEPAKLYEPQHFL